MKTKKEAKFKQIINLKIFLFQVFIVPDIYFYLPLACPNKNVGRKIYEKSSYQGFVGRTLCRLKSSLEGKIKVQVNIVSIIK